MDDGHAKTAPVGSYPSGASLYRVLDMAGNVSEWVADWYGEHYYSQSPGRNPRGPDSGEERGLRGGSWGSEPDDVRSAFRGRYSPEYQGNIVGFRCAKDTE